MRCLEENYRIQEDFQEKRKKTGEKHRYKPNNTPDYYLSLKTAENTCKIALGANQDKEKNPGFKES